MTQTFPNPDDFTPMVDANDPSLDGEAPSSSGEGSAPDESGGGLRKRYEEALARIKELEGSHEAETTDLSERLMTQEYNRLGLDPERGIGKAIAVTYEGEPEGLAEFAAIEFEYFGKGHPMAPQIASGHAALDGLNDAAGSIPPPTEADELAAAEQAGRTDVTLTLKSNQLGQMLRQGET